MLVINDTCHEGLLSFNPQVPCPSPEFELGYKQGIADWNANGTDLSHHFICPLAKTAPHSGYCKGYDAALKFETSDQ